MAIPDFPVSILPFTDGEVIDPDEVYALFDDPDFPSKSLSVINGGLSETSIAPSFDIDFTYTQRGSHVDCESSAGTAALDYVPSLVFPGWQSVVSGTSSLSNKTPLKPVPGGCRSFYSPWACSVLVTWSIFWTFNNGSNNGRKSTVFLAFDGALDEASERYQGQTVYSNEMRGYRKARCFSGHTWIDTTAGWHDVGLYLLADSRHHLVRVHSVNLSLMQFKTGFAL